MQAALTARLAYCQAALEHLLAVNVGMLPGLVAARLLIDVDQVAVHLERLHRSIGDAAGSTKGESS